MIYGHLLNRSNAAVNQLVCDNLHHDPDSRVLEVGFGGGDLLFRIARGIDGGRVDGVEVSDEMLANARRKSVRLGLDGIVSVQLAGVDALPFDNAIFDRACSVHSIYFWPELDAGLQELARVIKPGGLLVLAFSSHSAMIEDGYTDRGFKVYSRQQVVDTCAQNGFGADSLITTERPRGGDIYVYRGVRQHER